MNIIPGILLCAVATLTSLPAEAAYPEKPVRIVVHFPPGGPTDLVARLIGQKLGAAWGQPVVIDNIPGASGNIGADRVAKAAPDGYTLLLAASTLAVNVTLHERLPYDLVRDFVPVSRIASSPFVLVVGNDVPASNVKDLVSFAKAHPGALTYASSGIGSASHLSGELFNRMAGIETRHIPYKGTTSAVPDLMTGRVSMAFATAAAILPFVREGKVRAIAATSTRRISSAPDLPTISESGLPAFETGTWFGLLAPAHTPPAIVNKIYGDVVGVLSQPDVRHRLDELGMEVVGDTPQEFDRFMRADIAKWAQVIKSVGLKRE